MFCIILVPRSQVKLTWGRCLYGDGGLEQSKHYKYDLIKHSVSIKNVLCLLNSSLFIDQSSI